MASSSSPPKSSPSPSPSPSPPPSPTSALRPSLKGKVRSPSKSRVSFAENVQEHHDETTLTTDDEETPLLNKSPDGEDDEAADQLTSLPSRLHRKLKRGLTIGRAKARKPGHGLPTYRNGNLMDHHEDDEYLTTQRALLYCVLALVFIALVLGAFVLVQSTDHNPTGPYPHPPIHTKPHTTHALPTGFPPPPGPTGLPRNPAYLVKGSNGAVATEHKDCSTMGTDMLKAGGNAVDAAIAATLCIGVVNMFSSGIGGGGFMMVRVPSYFTPIEQENFGSSAPNFNATMWSIDFRETTPAAGNETMFGDDPFKSLFGGLSVGVPGEIRGLAEAHTRWGRLPWKQVVMPSAHLARGWRVGKELDRRLKWLGSFMHHSRDWYDIFAPTGHLLTEGELIKRTTYAQTLSLIAKEGPDAFYSRSSKIARSIIKKVQQEGGIMTLKDLEDYQPVVEKALEGSYRGKKVWVNKAPSCGPVLLHVLNLLELFDLSEGPTPLNIHRIVEVLKFGFAARTRISDPVSSADIKRMSDIHTKEFAKEVFARITDNMTHTPDYYKPVFDVPTDHGTTHLSVVDKDGMAVAITSTVNLVFGSRVLDPATGIIFNDELDDFSRPGMSNAFGLPPSPYNYASPNKRPLSSTSPVIIETSSGELFAALGGSGGSRIFGAVLQVILNLEWGMDISKAVEEPRVHDQLFPLETSIESGFNKAAMKSLKKIGHNITVFDINLGVAEVQAVVRDTKTGELSAASDSRKNGIADAF